MKNLLPLIGIFIFIYIITQVDLLVIIDVMMNMDAWYFIIASLLMIPQVFIKTIKWETIIKSYDIKYPLIKATSAWLKAFFLGIITPGRIGDLTRARYLKRDMGISIGKSLTTVIIDRIIDVVVLFSISIAGLAFLFTTITGIGGMAINVIILFAFFLISLLILFNQRIMYRFFKPINVRVVPEKYHKSIDKLFNDFYHGIDKLKRNKLIFSLMLGLASWLLMIVQFYLLSLSLGINLEFFFFFALVALVVLFDTLPISFSGIGTRDATVVFLFSLVMITPEMGISLSLLALIVTYLMPGFAGLMLWIKEYVRPCSISETGN